MSIKTEIVWHKASEELPKKSGDYMVASVNAFGQTYSITNCHYSSRYQLFNCQDYDTPKSAWEYSIDASYWAEILMFPGKSNE